MSKVPNILHFMQREKKILSSRETKRGEFYWIITSCQIAETAKMDAEINERKIIFIFLDMASGN